MTGDRDDDATVGFREGVTVVVELPADTLSYAAEDVVRLAGGASTRSEGMLRARIAALRPRLLAVAEPRYAVAVHTVTSAADHRLSLAGGRSLSFGMAAAGATPAALAAVVCTMGTGVDAAEAEISAASGTLDAWMFDALALAALEALELVAWRDVARGAAGRGLYVGTPLVPAVGDLPPGAQHELFACVDAVSAGVNLDASGTMSPLKSFSCWVPLVTTPTDADATLHLCESCDREACRFRRP